MCAVKCGIKTVGWCRIRDDSMGCFIYKQRAGSLQLNKHEFNAHESHNFELLFILRILGFFLHHKHIGFVIDLVCTGIVCNFEE
jgi:hypothetical protein